MSWVTKNYLGALYWKKLERDEKTDLKRKNSYPAFLIIKKELNKNCP